MVYFIDISGLLLYLVFRIVILPVLAVVGCFFMLLFAIKAVRFALLRLQAVQLRLPSPLFRLAKLRLLSIGK